MFHIGGLGIETRHRGGKRAIMSRSWPDLVQAAGQEK
jgi:hypothetical protein